MSIRKPPHRLWLDIETTHLDEYAGSIIEIACIVADVDHQPLGHFESTVLPDTGGSWNQWAHDQHQASGLHAECLRARPLAVVLTDLDLWLSAALPSPVPLAGCSPQFDRAWLRTHIKGYGLTDILRHFTHRYFDLSTLLAEAADVGDPIPESTDPPHRALADCRRALQTARMLRQLRRSR